MTAVVENDALNAVLKGLKLKAEVYQHANFCGSWGVNTSGSTHVPFHLVASGHCYLHIEGQAPRLLEQGDLVVFPRDNQHLLSSEKSLTGSESINQPRDPQPDEDFVRLICGHFLFESQASWPILDSLADVLVLCSARSPALKGLEALLQLIMDELTQAHPGTQAVVEHLAQALFVKIVRTQFCSREGIGLLSALLDPRLSKAMSGIHLEPQKSWSLQSLAHAAGMSRTSFTEYFGKKVGMTPLRYVTQWRMRLACVYLTTSQYGLTQIAEDCGYSSDISFRKAFKNEIGTTPASYRRQHALVSGGI